MLDLGPRPQLEADLPDLHDGGADLLRASALLHLLRHPDVLQVLQPAEELAGPRGAGELGAPVQTVVEGVALAGVDGAHRDLGEVGQGRGGLGQRDEAEAEDEASGE